jgi:general transcription factor 3C polypeptide 5 (transcription factor C subunit 1)
MEATSTAVLVCRTRWSPDYCEALRIFGLTQSAAPRSLAAASMSEDAVPSQAPEHPLPPARFYSVEYPGYVQPASAPRAVAQLGGARALDFAFRRASTKQERIVELRLRPDNPFAHPIAGEVVGTHNLLLRVVRRRRKPRAADGVDAGSGASEPLGEYTAEVVGAIPKTVRFRSERMRG